jgi:long-chain acyl-CoA synthetase
MKVKSLSRILSDLAKHTPDKVFLHQLSETKDITYSQLWEASLRTYQWMQNERIAKGSRIIFAAKNHWAVYPLLVACTLRDCHLIPLDPNLHPEELMYVLSHSSPSYIVFDQGSTRNKIFDKIPNVSFSEIIQSDLPLQPPLNENPGESGILLMYTSGTTGGAKAVSLTEINLVTMGVLFREFYKIQPDDRFYCILPTYHMNAIMLTGVLPLVSGATVYLSDTLSFKNAKYYWENLAKYQITVASLVPSILSLLLKLRKEQTQVSKTIRFGFCGAAPLPERLWKEFENTFGFPIYQGYGLTETTGWAVAIPPGPREYNSVGIPLGCEVLIDTSRDLDQSDIVLGLESESDSEVNSETEKPLTGEILIRGPIVMKEYYRNKALTNSQLRSDGFLKTGDVGFIGKNGFVQVTGRIKEIIIRNGTNISSGDVDSVLSTHPAVQECKTIGIKDELVGERVHSVCILKESANETPENLLSWVKEVVRS